MNVNKGIRFVIGGVILYLILPRLLYFFGIYFIPRFIFSIGAIILIIIGIIIILKNKKKNELSISNIQDDSKIYNQNSSNINQKLMNKKIKFTGNFGEYFIISLGLMLLSIITFGLATPYWMYWSLKYFFTRLEIVE
ncbi:hypothetical protein [Lutibacter sp.]|uniref:hypothetical protein n=1 Tax=Lutibacter sp. TaxID=1925666 RepID=UPI0025C1609B|nr:hypothetical protein [Lutibacter sp.]MCF6182703.1 DUF898 domain-containing protein [Lutibacter sp.]